MAADSAPGPFGLARRERILDELRQAGSVRVVDLARTLGVAELTVRRDLRELADRGLLSRVHGGATLRSRLDTSVPLAAPRVAAARFRVGMVVPSLSYYWPQIVIGARAAATEAGIQLILRCASYSADDQRRQISALIASGGIHGLIVAPETSGPDGYTTLQWLDSLPVPVVLAERRASTSLALTRVEWVATDHALGGALAARHLAGVGHRRVGILTDAKSPTSWQLRQGWARTIAELGLDAPLDLDASLDDLSGAERVATVDAILAKCADSGTTGMLIHSDRQALMIQQQAIDHGWSMPGDLAIVAYDDELAANGEHPITALRPPKQHVGRLAVETMGARLAEGPRRPVQRMRVLPTLHVRDSTPLMSAGQAPRMDAGARAAGPVTA